MAKAGVNTTGSQRSRSYYNPIDLGRFSRTSIRYLTGRIGAENKGQAQFRCDNSGASFAFQNVWFGFRLDAPSYVILVQDSTNSRTNRFIDLTLYDTKKERKSMGHPILFDGMNSYYRGMVAGSQCDLYNVLDQRQAADDQDRTSLLPLPKGNYVLGASTQRWDQIRYGIYMIIETPITSGFILLENEPTTKGYIEQEVSTSFIPAYFLLEDASLGEVDTVRRTDIHDYREWQEAWTDVYPGKPFPSDLTTYLDLANADNID